MVSLAEKYRPKTLEDFIGNDDVKDRVQNCIDKGFGNIPPLVFIGPPGCGKTSMAEIICYALFGDKGRQHWKELNASDDRGIKVVREDIKNFARIIGQKIIFLTEADNMTSEAQNALRRTMEVYQKNTLFILDCNYPEKLIGPILSRCAKFWFKPIDKREMLIYIMKILVKEKVKIPRVPHPKKPGKLIVAPEMRKAMKQLVKISKGDLRSALNDIETLITKDLEITYKNILAVKPSDEAPVIFEKAFMGDIEGSIELLEDFLVQQNYRWELLFESWYELLLNMPHKGDTDQEKANHKEIAYNIMFIMGEFEDRCRSGNVPLYQLSSFLAYVWRAPSLMEA